MTSVSDFGTLIQGFKLSCQTEGKSPKTIEWYIAFLSRFQHFLITTGFPTAIDQIGKNHIKAFILYLQENARTPHGDKPLSGATVQDYVRTLKAFFSWCAREDYLVTNPLAKIPIPKAATHVINTFSEEQITRLVGEVYRSDGSACRNIAMLLLMLDSGLRVSELVNIDCDDGNLTEGYIRIKKGKGGKERLVPVGSLVQISINDMTHY